MDKAKVILAKYWVAILCGVVALGSVIANFVPLSAYHAQVHDELAKSAANYTAAEGLLTKPRKKPLLPGQAEQQDLTEFPSASLINSGQKLRDDLNKDADQVVADLVLNNTHIPLVAGVLPNPGGAMAPIDYRTAYINRIGTGTPRGSLYTQVLMAGLPPTTAEIDTEGKSLFTNKYDPMIVKDNSGQPINADSVNAQYAAELATLPQQMRLSRAQACKVYVDATALPLDTTVANVTNVPPNPSQIWWSQFSLWVEEDVASAIANVNKDAKDVTESPIKRIIKLDMPPDGPGVLFNPGKPFSAGASTPAVGGADASAGAPSTVVSDETTPLVLDPKASPSGRVSCPMYDVVNFRLDLVVSAKDLPLIIQRLAQNRLLSVLNIESITTEDAILDETNGYVFGSGPVVHVVIRCESLYLRKWSLPLMPESVKRLLAAPSGGTAS